MSGIHDLPGMYATGQADQVATDGLTMSMVYLEQHQGRMGKPLWSAPKRYTDNSPYFHADEIRTPLLILHGSEDSNSPVGEAEKLFNSLVRLGRTSQLVVYRREGHVPAEWSQKKPNRLDEPYARLFGSISEADIGARQVA